MIIESTNVDLAQKPSFCQTPVTGSTGLNVLSLFDGMSCGRIALERVGIKVNKYYASEIDKHAIKVTQHNYPDTIQLGDVTKVKIKLLCLSDVYSYICNYDSNLQSNISEWEVLYWLNKDFTLSAKIRTQKPNERQEVSETSTVQRIEEVWFSKREMGSVRKFGDYTTSRRDGEENDIRVPKQLQYGKWGYDNDIYRRYKKENIGIASGETKNGDSEKKNFRNIEEAIFKGRESEGCFRENKKSNVEEGCSGKLFERKKEDRLSREVEKEKGNRRTKEGNFINEVIRELCRWNETDGIAQDYWNILRLHKAEQITVVEHEAGFYLFKGRIDLCIGGSPCQGFSFAGKGLNFEDPRSKLFFEFTRLLKECKPKYFLLENVKMKQEFQDIINEQLGIKPILINSSLVSAQNRERLYWTNIPIQGLPDDKGLFLKDVIEIGTGKKLSEQTAQRPRTLRNYRSENQKAFCMLATMWKGSQSNGMTVIDDNGLRNITPLECERLQTVPDNYTNVVADTNRYTMLGNGWTVDVIAHIFGGLS